MLLGSYLWCLFCLCMVNTPTGSLTVHITGFETRKGTVRVALYPNKSAYDEEVTDPALGKVLSDLSGEACTLQWADLPYGTYALAVYHDINDNGKLDTNVFGIPTEPYAFSNNPDVKWRRPRYGEVSFQMESPGITLQVKLDRWSEK